MTAPLTRAQLEASMHEITFAVPVAPRGWARPRRNGNVYFLDQGALNFRNAVIAFAAQAMQRYTLLEGPVAMTVISIIPVPDSWSEKKRAAALAGQIRPASKPDADNLAKGVSDALNKVVYRDDAQIVDLRSIKFYGAKPEVQIAISEVAK